MAAIDGDPGTWWGPGFLDQGGEYVDYVSAEPVTVDRFALTVLADGRHSVPRALLVSVGDGSGPDHVQEVALPDVADGGPPGSTHTFEVDLPEAVRGVHVRVGIPDRDDAVREVETLDWFTSEPVALPVAFAELGIEGLSAPAMPDQVDDRCRDDLLTVEGEPVAVSLRGTTADLLAGRAIEAVGCDPLDLAAGTVDVRTEGGAFTGVDLDRVVLRSAAGGDADDDDGTLVPGSRPGDGRPDVRVDHQDRTSLDLTVTGADDAFWLVLGQSGNAGWTATADGRDLGPPTLVNGYANGWEVPAGQTISVHLEWTPQRVVWAALGASLLGVLVALVLAAWPRRAVIDADADARLPLDARPSMARPLRLRRLLRYAGPTPSRLATALTVAGAWVLGTVVIGALPGVVLGGAALLALRVPRSRPLLTLGGPLLLVGCVGYLAARQWWSDFPSGFAWPTYFEVVHQPAWTAVGLVVLDVVVDRCWLRRWWPTDDSPA
jgi:arabinofuranan 3-O-arabinosyltransferase